VLSDILLITPDARRQAQNKLSDLPIGRDTGNCRYHITAGEKLFVDWAGDTMPIFDPTTGEEYCTHIFIAALGASNYTYAEARWTETLPDWIGAHLRWVVDPNVEKPSALAVGRSPPSIQNPDSLRWR